MCAKYIQHIYTYIYTYTYYIYIYIYIYKINKGLIISKMALVGDSVTKCDH